jgi:hypothetical protein
MLQYVKMVKLSAFLRPLLLRSERVSFERISFLSLEKAVVCTEDAIGGHIP